MSITDTAATGHPWATQSQGYTYDSSTGCSLPAPQRPATTLTPTTSSTTPRPITRLARARLAHLQRPQPARHLRARNTYAYDANGNTLTGDGARTYKWDAENRLIEIDYVGTSNKTVFTYDGIGHRMVDAETVGGTTTSTRYLWCGSTICQTRNSLDTVLKRDLPEGEYNVSTGQKLIYMPDQLGSVRDVLDATNGNLVQSYDYSPYGAVARSSGSTPTDYQYARLFGHPASLLNLSATRSQDGVTGRWQNRDRLKEVAGPNLYGYVKANPTNWIDQLGLSLTLPPTGQIDSTLPRAGPLKQSASDANPWSLFPTSPLLPSSSSANKCSFNDSNSTSPQNLADTPVEVAGGSDFGPPCSGPGSNCETNFPGSDKRTRGTYGNPDSPGEYLCPDCFFQSQGRRGTGKDVP